MKNVAIVLGPTSSEDFFWCEVYFLRQRMRPQYITWGIPIGESSIFNMSSLL